MKTHRSALPEKKKQLIMAAVQLMVMQGYAGTSVEDICSAAGVTKGSFFHYFANKEEIAKAAMDAWACGWHEIVDAAHLEQIEDPLDRVFGLFEVMSAAYLSSPVGKGCMIGTVAQELARHNEPLREIFAGHFKDWVDRTARLLDEAKAAHPPAIDFDSVEVAWWLQSFVQGTLLIAKSRTDDEFILANIRHCRAYVAGLFGYANSCCKETSE